MDKEYNMSLASANLSYANDELVRALNYLADFINIDNNTFNSSNINDLKDRIDNQIYNINNNIIPDIRAEV